jgi:Kef-type K+ transport system membrane component KefB
MGLELSIARLNAMKKDVFGLGTMQFLLTSAAGSLVLMGMSQGGLHVLLHFHALNT